MDTHLTANEDNYTVCQKSEKGTHIEEKKSILKECQPCCLDENKFIFKKISMFTTQRNTLHIIKTIQQTFITDG